MFKNITGQTLFVTFVFCQLILKQTQMLQLSEEPARENREEASKYLQVIS